MSKSEDRKLIQMKLDDIRHAPNYAFFDPTDGTAYYGPNEDSLVVLSSVTFWHQRRPPAFYVTDMISAFKLGLAAGLCES